MLGISGMTACLISIALVLPIIFSRAISIPLIVIGVESRGDTGRFDVRGDSLVSIGFKLAIVILGDESNEINLGLDGDVTEIGDTGLLLDVLFVILLDLDLVDLVDIGD